MSTPDPTTADPGVPLDVLVRVTRGVLQVTPAAGAASVSVQAAEPGDEAAEQLAAAATVERDGSRLLVDVARRGRVRRGARVRVVLGLPPGCLLRLDAADVVVDAADAPLGGLLVRARDAELALGQVSGEVDLKCGQVDLRMRTGRRLRVTAGRALVRAEGADDVSVKAGHGQVELGEVAGNVRVRGGGVALTVREARSGEVIFETGAGSATVGVAAGTLLQVDLTSGAGEVRCDVPLDDVAPVGGSDLRVRLRTGSGDVVVRRAAVAVPS